MCVYREAYKRTNIYIYMNISILYKGNMQKKLCTLHRTRLYTTYTGFLDKKMRVGGD